MFYAHVRVRNVYFIIILKIHDVINEDSWLELMNLWIVMEHSYFKGLTDLHTVSVH